MTELITTGVTIIDEESRAIHNCAPFCPNCGHRLWAFGTLKFRNATIAHDGWRNDISMDEDCTEINAECINEECPRAHGWFEIHFCYGQEPNCAKEPDLP